MTDLQALLKRYTEGPEQLEAALADLEEASLDVAKTPDSWTIRQIVHHVADGDDLWSMCIKAALGDSRGLFSYCWYWEKPQAEWADNWTYAGREVEPSLALFRANRRHISQLLHQMPGAWEKYTLITLPDGEEEATSVREVVEMQTQHLEGHIEDIQAIRKKHNL
ncbi:MAG: DinB family protein [Anaerolineales bacterium]|nr:MAG: DinB family protein [Anaerolineales bacterium]